MANLPPESTTLANLVAKFAASVVDTGGKNAAGVVDTAAILPPVSLIPVAIWPPVSLANLPPVSLILVVHLDLQISLLIFEKI